MPPKSTTGYGTIPTTATPPPPSTPSTLFATARFHTENFVAKRRPWLDFVDYSAISLPPNLDAAVARIKRNLNYFRVNYTMVMILVLFLTLLRQPGSMIMFLVVFSAWFFLYFFRDGRSPVVIFNHVFDDRVVLIGLSLLTIVAFAFTDMESSVLMALGIGAAVVGLHAALRSTDDLFLDEQEAVDGGLVSVVGGQSSVRKN